MRSKAVDTRLIPAEIFPFIPIYISVQKCQSWWVFLVWYFQFCCQNNPSQSLTDCVPELMSWWCLQVRACVSDSSALWAVIKLLLWITAYRTVCLWQPPLHQHQTIKHPSQRLLWAADVSVVSLNCRLRCMAAKAFKLFTVETDSSCVFILRQRL